MTSTKSFKPLIAFHSNDNILINFNERLGDWAYGSIYKGYSKSLAKKVMVKVIDTNKCPLPVSFVENEINILKKLKDNKNVAKLIEEQTTDNNRMIVIEMCDQGTLRTLLQESGPIPEEKARRFLKQIIRALREVHENRFAHGSLRPENIYLYKDPNSSRPELVPKLANFTFSRHYASAPLERAHLPQDINYLAPEVLKSLKFNPRSDLWSLGVIYYEMLYGTPPFSGATRKELEASFIGTPLHFPAEKGISEESITFIERCLQRSPLKRLEWSDLSPHKELFQSLFGSEEEIYGKTVEIQVITPPPVADILNMSRRNLTRNGSGHATSKSMSLINGSFVPRFSKTPAKSHKRQASTIENLTSSSFLSMTNAPSEIAGYSSHDPYISLAKSEAPLTDRQLTCPFDQSMILHEIQEESIIEPVDSKPKKTSAKSMTKVKPISNTSLDKITSSVVPVLQVQTNNFYQNLLAHMGTSGDYQLAKMNASRSTSNSTSNPFSLPFKWLSYKAEILGQIYNLANGNKDYPLYDKIMKILEQEVAKLNNGLGQVAETKEKMQTEVHEIAKRRETIHTDSIRIGAPKVPVIKFNLASLKPKVKKQSLVKKEKSKEIYELLKEILKTLLIHGKKNVNNEDIVRIAANFKVFREFEEIGDNVVRDLESLKDIMLVFYRKKHYDHLKYLLLVKNLV